MTSVLPQLHPHFVSQLPADAERSNTPRSVEHAAYSWVKPTPTKLASVVCCNTELAKDLGFSNEALASDEFALLVTGNQLDEVSQTYAMNYGGHQFGHWAGQLGDGRAINLGQYQTSDGFVTMQLKGAGKTPYSRHADGMAVLRSSIREYLCSEAMYHLGIPTTRALSLSLTGEQVIRDKLYDGHADYEPCAIVSRISPSFLRFGSVQLPSSRGDIDLLKQTVDYSISNDFSELLNEDKLITKQTYLDWFSIVTERTAKLIVEWMRVGFVHGVLNTDNMSIIGETIDYGPYGWIDNFDLNWTPNTSDANEKRYRFGKQPYIGQWNLFQLANALYPLIEEAEPLQAILSNYNHIYNQHWLSMMLRKMGLSDYYSVPDLSQETLKALQDFCIRLEQILSMIDTDMTLFYRTLATWKNHQNPADLIGIKDHFSDCFYDLSQADENYLTQLSHWLQEYQTHLLQQNSSDEKRKSNMDKVNPCYILRNFQVQEAIELAENGDYSRVFTLCELLKTPYQQQEKYTQFEVKRPDWAMNKFGCSALSCSS